jgi:NodT family efflux transporter outer membrane factor (OMF) lipoprotein
VSSVWWRAFASKELNALEEKGLGRNFDVQAAIARIDQAKGVAALLSAPLFPRIDLGGTLDRQTGLSNKNTQQVAFLAGYELDFWGKNRAASDSAKALIAATSSDADTVAVTLTATIANTYFQILSLKERIVQAQRIAGDARRILSLMQEQQAAGAASELQVEQQRNATATFEANVPLLQQQLDQWLHLLAVLVGEQPGQLALGARDLRGLRAPEPRSGLPSSLLERRPDIQAAEARLVSANFDVGAARAAFLPSVTIGASAGLTVASLAKIFPATALTDTALGLAQPIFDGGRLQGQLDFDRAHVTELVATYRQTVLTALQDVEDALSAKRRLKVLAAANLEAVTSARRSQALAEQQYRLGGADYLTVLNTQRSLFQAEDAYLQVRLQQLQAAVGLFRALGGGFSGSGGTGQSPPATAGSPTAKPM